jgi:hypothetical protein
VSLPSVQDLALGKARVSSSESAGSKNFSKPVCCLPYVEMELHSEKLICCNQRVTPDF